MPQRPVVVTVTAVLAGTAALALLWMMLHAFLAVFALGFLLTMRIGMSGAGGDPLAGVVLPLVVSIASALGFLVAAVLFGIATFTIPGQRRSGRTLAMVGGVIAVVTSIGFIAVVALLSADLDDGDDGSMLTWLVVVVPAIVPIAAATCAALPAVKRWCVR